MIALHNKLRGWDLLKNEVEKLMPPLLYTETNHIRRLGVEIEFSGMSSEMMIQVLCEVLDGTSIKKSDFEYVIESNKYGVFLLELDASLIREYAKEKNLNNYSLNQKNDPLGLLVKMAAENFIPWEVVTPPLPMDQLGIIYLLVTELRKAGALGTRHAGHYAFGLHFNPETPDCNVDTILAYLRAYCCLYEWIVEKEKIDFFRKLTPFINHFSNVYIKKIIDVNYKPSMQQFIDDYLDFNPTRNRNLDMLPLFKYIDQDRVIQQVREQKINARPTFHYRLPNCEIDNPEWNIDSSWKNWLLVEKLVGQKELLNELCELYLKDLQRFTRTIDRQWSVICEHFLQRV